VTSPGSCYAELVLRWLPLGIVLLVLTELYLLLALGRLIGLGPTVALTVLTALLGAAMARWEGLRVWREWMLTLQQGRPPARGLFEGVLVLVGGALLILPGVLTDFAGLLLLFPLTRRAIARPLERVVSGQVIHTSVRFIGTPPPGAPSMQRRHGPHDVVDTTGETLHDHKGELPGR
jgi:UPF0716 protein FxsA